MCSTLAQVFFPKDNGKQSELSPNCWKHKKCLYYDIYKHTCFNKKPL